MSGAKQLASARTWSGEDLHGFPDGVRKCLHQEFAESMCFNVLEHKRLTLVSPCRITQFHTFFDEALKVAQCDTCSSLYLRWYIYICIYVCVCVCACVRMCVCGCTFNAENNDHNCLKKADGANVSSVKDHERRPVFLKDKYAPV